MGKRQDTGEPLTALGYATRVLAIHKLDDGIQRRKLLTGALLVRRREMLRAGLEAMRHYRCEWDPAPPGPSRSGRMTRLGEKRGV